jgi:hypothetical protein
MAAVIAMDALELEAARVPSDLPLLLQKEHLRLAILRETARGRYPCRTSPEDDDAGKLGSRNVGGFVRRHGV